MFTIAGMVPFKPYFLGMESAPWPRATSVQRCFRTLDIDVVGTTERHCTFFEMLGNFSFGDYYKEGAIGYAWSFVTETLGIDGQRLWITVHDEDDEAEGIWRDSVGVPEGRIQRMGDDNFWKMAETGPCGPCSEIYFDRDPSHGDGGGPAVSQGDRYVEIWNLVFMGLERIPDGTLKELPRRNIDTGAGLERILPVVEGVDSMFETDLFVPLIDKARSVTGSSAHGAQETAALRIMADHARAMVSLIADGVVPSNDGRGSVLRRIVRRAILKANRLGASGAVTVPMAEVAIEALAAANGALPAGRDMILATLEREEAGFLRTLQRGTALIEEEIARGESMGCIAGTVAFTLHDTFGFPIELTREMAAERGLVVDMEGFAQEMEAQRHRAREAIKRVHALAGSQGAERYAGMLQATGPTRFIGYDQTDAEASVLGVFFPAREEAAWAGRAVEREDRSLERRRGEDGSAEGRPVEVVLDTTPFYAESGGQVGDSGEIVVDGAVVRVLDTQHGAPGVTVHRGLLSGREIEPGERVRASIDVERRESLRRNHTGTHLVHWALRSVLGDHVRQQGSLVAPGRLRFDFSHHSRVGGEELREIQRVANYEVLTNAPVSTTVTDMSSARSMGALAFFGDRYGQEVRVVQAGSRSVELCGGTHVGALGSIGPLVVVSESSIGSNTRRIEALSGMPAAAMLLERAGAVDSLSRLLNVEPMQVVDEVDGLMGAKRDLEKELERRRVQRLTALARDLVASAGGDSVVVARADGLAADELREVSLQVRGGGIDAVVLAGVPDPTSSKVAMACVAAGGYDAAQLVKSLAPLVGGGGGGTREVAVAGGRDPSGIDSVLAEARRILLAGA